MILIIFFSIFIIFSSFSFSTAQDAAEPTVISLEQAIHVLAPNGDVVLIGPGTYQVEQGEEGLRLVPKEKRNVILIQAQGTEHQETIESPLALSIPSGEDQHHIALLFPNGKSVEAVGSYSGIRPRGLKFAPFSGEKLKQAFQARMPLVQFKRTSPSLQKPGLSVAPSSKALEDGPEVRIAGAPTPPILKLPVQPHTISERAVVFSWQTGAGTPRPTYYKVCVTPSSHQCGSPESWIYPPPGEQRVTGTALKHDLPEKFQGLRLRWSVAACAPNPQRPAIGGGIVDSCSWARSRQINWPLPAPILQNPSHNITLRTFSPQFRWHYANMNGVDHFLLCIAKPGVTCLIREEVQPDVFVAKVQGAREFSLPKDLTPFMGQKLHWTVAACNTTFRCRYQTQVRVLNVPAPAGTFAALYPFSQHSKCTNCHGMDGENEKFQQHVREGRIPANTDFGRFVPQPLCKNCHTAATGFVNGWHAPNGNFDFSGRPITRMCQGTFRNVVHFSGEISGRDHLKNDRLILWAVARIPDLGVPKWHRLVDAWFDAGAPCPCEAGRCDFGKRPYGQFTR